MKMFHTLSRYRYALYVGLDVNGRPGAQDADFYRRATKFYKRLDFGCPGQAPRKSYNQHRFRPQIRAIIGATRFLKSAPYDEVPPNLEEPVMIPKLKKQKGTQLQEDVCRHSWALDMDARWLTRSSSAL